MRCERFATLLPNQAQPFYKKYELICKYIILSSLFVKLTIKWRCFSTQANTQKWSSAETVTAANKALAGKASTWIDNLIREAPEVRSDWNALKLKLQGRFGNILSLTERVKVLATLNQRVKVPFSTTNSFECQLQKARPFYKYCTIFHYVCKTV